MKVRHVFTGMNDVFTCSWTRVLCMAVYRAERVIISFTHGAILGSAEVPVASSHN